MSDEERLEQEQYADEKKEPEEVEKTEAAAEVTEVKEEAVSQEAAAAGKKTEKRGILGIIVKLLIIAVIIAGGVYAYIYFQAEAGKANLLLSDNEIESADSAVSIVRFKVNNKVYFLINRNTGVLGAQTAVLEIEKSKDNAYEAYKKISYEIDKQFAKLSAYIPAEYFSIPGKYKIKTKLDNVEIASQEITIIE
ncbi:MAG: hypothetical protein GY754_25560 [bacterium]|nr:hypothetical protein [bacterium]